MVCLILLSDQTKDIGFDRSLGGGETSGRGGAIERRRDRGEGLAPSPRAQVPGAAGGVGSVGGLAGK